MDFSTITAAFKNIRFSKAMLAKVGIPALVLLITGGTLFWWLNFRTRTDHFAAIPKDAVAVVKMNVGQVLKKSEIKEIKEFQQELESGIDDDVDDANVRKLLKEVIKNPKKSGFDIMSPVAIAVTNLEKPQIIFVAPVNSRKRLQKNIQTLLDASEKNKIKLIEEDDYTVLKSKEDESVNMAFNDKRFVAVISTQGKAKKASKYVLQKKDASILKDDKFKEFVKSKDDAVMFVDFDPVFNFAKKQGGNLGDNLEYMKGTSMLASLNFDKGSIVCKAKINASDKLRKTIERNWTEPAGTVLNNVPKDAFAVAQMGISGSAAKRSLSSMPNNVRSEIQEGVQMITGRNYTIDQIGDLLEGTVAAYAVLTSDVPDWGIVISGKSELVDIVRDSFNKFAEEEAAAAQEPNEFGYYDRPDLIRNGNVYVLGANSRNPYYLTLDGTLMTLTSTSGSIGKSYSGEPAEQYLKSGGFYVDFEKLWSNASVNDALNKTRGLKSFVSIFKNAHLTSKENGLAAEFVIEMTDSKKNALAQITRAAFDFYKMQKKENKKRRNDDDERDDDYTAATIAFPEEDENDGPDYSVGYGISDEDFAAEVAD